MAPGEAMRDDGTHQQRQRGSCTTHPLSASPAVAPAVLAQLQRQEPEQRPTGAAVHLRS
jgi:hypothetical protein